MGITRGLRQRAGGGRDVTDVWVANDEGTELIRARDIAVADLDYDGNVKVRLAGADGAVVTVVAHRAHHEEHRPGDLHRQLVRVIAELSDAAGAFLVRAEYNQTRGWLSVPPSAGRTCVRYARGIARNAR